MANRVLVVGWDGADWDVLDPLLAAGELPALQSLVARGQRGVSRSCLPSHSWAAWPTFLTGRDPGGHGVFDILEYLPGASRRAPVSWQSILAPTWPARLSDAGKRTLLVNVPLTYPPPPIDGVVIAGGVVPPRRPFSHPESVGPELGWPINGGSWTTFRGRPLDFLADLESLTTRRAEAMRRLLDEEPWDVACLVFVSTDRAQHCLLEYVHPGHPDHAAAAASPVADRVRGLYRLLDAELGSLLERIDDDDLVIFMSDHGHHPCTRAVSMNKVLEHLGFLRFAPGSTLVNLLSWGKVRSAARVVYDRLGLHGRVKLPTPPIDWAKTRAYTSVVSTGEGVSLNLVGREPGATVARDEYERVRDEVAEALLEFTDPETGMRPIGAVLRKEEILSGPYLDRAPDLLLSPAPLYSLSHARRLVEQADWLSGDHRPEGVYVLAGRGVGPGEGPELSLASFAGTIVSGVGLAPDEDWSFDPTVVGTPDAFTEEEERLVEERLRGLGYLE
ncbi:MAG TPA: alkaline phosphatase family protein [Gaiellaceae bacterium]|nr:alkaline phosphatase family protein [Gaiellaceae bacterium]